MSENQKPWWASTPPPMPPRPAPASQPAAQAAVRALEHLGYTYHGAELWKPPLGKPPRFITEDTASQPVGEAVADGTAFSDGIEAAAAWVDDRREQFDDEFGSRDPDTGAFEFRSASQEEYSSELAEIAAGIRGLAQAGPADGTREASFQQRVQPWMLACFGAEIAADAQERNHRFLEEALELVQACGATASEAHQLVDYVYGRPVGEKTQEVGGVMVTLAALCLAQGLDMHAAGETELARIWTKVEQIRAKQAAKPKHSPLPEHVPSEAQAGLSDAAIAALRRIERAVNMSLGRSPWTQTTYLKGLAYAEAVRKELLAAHDDVRAILARSGQPAQEGT